MIASETECRVLYAHTDKMGVVNNARYLEYFEAGRNDLLRKLGAPYTAFESQNIGLPVIEAYAKFILPAKYDDVISIRSMINSMPSVRFRIEYELRLDSSLLVTGHTVHSFINLQTLRPARPPADFIDMLKEKFDNDTELL